MEFTVKKADILKELNLVQGVVEKRNTIPILSNVLLEATTQGLVIMATDLDLSIRAVCNAEVKQGGALCVSAKKLHDIVRLLPEADINFKLGGGERLTLTCDKSVFKIVGLPRDNFPTIPAFAGKKVRLEALSLREMIRRTAFAITQEESRYALGGALLKLSPDHLEMVATDGHRLALVEKRGGCLELDETISCLIPKKALVELEKLCSELTPGSSPRGGEGEGGEIEFGQDGNHLFFELGRRTLVSRILAGQFPNYEAVIPRESDKEVVIETQAAASAIRRAEIMADERSHAVKLIIDGEGRSTGSPYLEVAASRSDLGEAHESLMPVSVKHKGGRLEIIFNAQYLLDFLSVASTEQVSFLFKDEETQALLKPVSAGGQSKGQGEEYNYQYVVMPMRL